MIRLLCVGVGGMGRSDRLACEKTGAFDVAAGVDVNDAARERFEDETGRPTFDTFAEARANTEADAALVATPDEYHAPLSIEALEAGLDVMCEKPMAPTLDAAIEMHHAAKRNGRLLMIHHQVRWNPSYRRAHHLIREGAIGKVRHIELDLHVFSGACLKGYRSRLPQLMLQDLGIHHFDLMRFLIGEECRSVYARSWISPEDTVAVPATTNTYAILEMTGPVTASYRAQMRSITRLTGYACEFEMTGSKGVLTFREGKLSLQTYEAFAEKQPPQVIEVEEDDGAVACMQAFADAIGTRQPAWTDSGDNVRSLQVLLAAIRSADTGGIVQIGDPPL